MKTIDIKSQPRLGLARTFQITLNGIRYRLFRSSVTLVVISVAIAFLMNILTEGMIKASLVGKAEELLSEYRVAAVWISRLTSPSSAQGLLLELGAIPDESDRAREMAAFGGLDDEALRKLLEGARIGREFILFFDQMEYGRLRLLTGGAQGLDAFDRLSQNSGWETFLAERAQMRSLRLPTEVADLRTFLDSWPETKQQLSAIRDGQARAIAQVRQELKGQTLLTALTEANGTTGAIIRNAGFSFPPERAAMIETQAKRSLTADQVEAALEDPTVRRSVAVRLNLLPQEVNAWALWPVLAGKEGSQWFTELNPTSALNPVWLQAIAQQRMEEQKLQKIEPLIGQMGGGILGVGQRMSWLIGLSMVVCSVGIANAMLMSVTERYREIATFKCLGALDGSIMLIFIIEAALLGSVGGLLGAITGATLGILATGLTYGELVFISLPVAQILGGVVLAIFVGVFLAAAASIYPSLKAAKLAPMEAMRIE